MLPAVGKDTWLEMDGLRMHCFVAGETGSTIMLLHGGGLDSALLSWGQVIGPLSDHHRVFAPLPARLRAERPTSNPVYDGLLHHLPG